MPLGCGSAAGRRARSGSRFRVEMLVFNLSPQPSRQVGEGVPRKGRSRGERVSAALARAGWRPGHRKPSGHRYLKSAARHFSSALDRKQARTVAADTAPSLHLNRRGVARAAQRLQAQIVPQCKIDSFPWRSERSISDEFLALFEIDVVLHGRLALRCAKNRDGTRRSSSDFGRWVESAKSSVRLHACPAGCHKLF